MNLEDCDVPPTFPEMKISFESYYNSFSLELVRMSNANLQSYIDTMLLKLSKLSRSADTKDQMRAAIGVVSLHNFGFKNFEHLSQIFDHLIPQVEPEPIKFTSWCAGQLIVHPNFEQSQYVQHLLGRSFAWIRNRGKRARHLAAACLIENLSISAGSSIISFLPHVQSALWALVSQPSVQIIAATTEAFGTFTQAILSYGRSDLESFLDFSTELCSNFLSGGSTIKKYAALILFQKLIDKNSDYFVPKFSEWYLLFKSALSEMNKPIIRASAYATMACLSDVDAKQFREVAVEMLYGKTGEFIVEFPKEVVGALCKMVKNVPEFMMMQKDGLMNYCRTLVDKPDCAFNLLESMIWSFGDSVRPVDKSLISQLMVSPITGEYQRFFVSLTNTSSTLSEDFQIMFSKRILSALQGEVSVNTLEMLAELPRNAMVNHEEIIAALTNLAVNATMKVRSCVPRALFHLAPMSSEQKSCNIVDQLMYLAVFDRSCVVRSQILRVFSENLCKDLAKPEFMKFYKIFVNDDSQQVRKLAFKLLARLVTYNPMHVTAIMRNSLLDYFFILQNVASLRQRARTIGTLPVLIKASSQMIETYSSVFLEIAMAVLRDHTVKKGFDNFLEQDADTAILSGIIDSVALLAPLDPDRISSYANEALPIVCNYLRDLEERQLVLSVCRLFEVLLKAPACSVAYRLHTPMILSVCTDFLAKTRSRKARITILRVFGAIGVLEVHQRQPSRVCKSPENMDNRLTREFFQPARDAENIIDDTLLLSDDTHDQYNISWTAAALLKIVKNDNMKEFYMEAIQALVQVLGKPIMSILNYYDSFCARFLELMNNASDAEFTCYIPMLTQLIRSGENNMLPFTGRVVALIERRSCDKMSMSLMDVILALVDAVRDGISTYATGIICMLLRSLATGKNSQTENSCKVFVVFQKLCLYSGDLVYLIVPQVCDLIECRETLDEVRIAAIQCLQQLIRITDLSSQLGSIVRSLLFCLDYKEQKTKLTALQLINTLIKDQGKQFNESAAALIQYLDQSKLESSELKKLISNPFSLTAQPAPEDDEEEKPCARSTFIFSDDAVIARALTPNYGGERYMKQWLRSFKLCVITNCPSSPIRACTTLAASYTPLATDLFKPAFLSCWRNIRNRGKVQISKSLRQLLLGTHVVDAVAQEIIDLLVFMKKVDQPLLLSREDLVTACMRYGNFAFALKLITEYISENGAIDEQSMSTLIEIYSQTNSWANATWIWQINKAEKDNVEVLRRLKMWDTIEPHYREIFEKKKDMSAFRWFAKSLNSQAKWPELLTFYPMFKSELTRNQQRDVSEYFALAAFNVGDWDVLDDVLQYSPNYSFRSTILSALNSLHRGDFAEAEGFVDKGFWLIASTPITFWGENQRIRRDTMLSCQQLVEIQEMITWVKEPEKRLGIEAVWVERMKTAPQDFYMWYNLISNRVRITNQFDTDLIKMFQMKSQLLGTKLHANIFSCLFKDFDFETCENDISRLCHVITLWTMGNRDEALKKITKLAETAKTLETLCRFFYASWLTEYEPNQQNLQEAYRNLNICISSIAGKPPMRYTSLPKAKGVAAESLFVPNQLMKSLAMDVKRADMLRKWAEVNIGLAAAEPDNIERYVTNAIDALASCAQISPMFPDVVQLLNLFFENADKSEIFHSTAHSCIRTLGPKLLLQASPQLLVQLSHGSLEVAKFVHDTVFDLMRVHYHDLVFSVIVMKYSKHKERAEMAVQILNEFRNLNPNAYDEVKLIRTTMLRAAVTWNELVQQRIMDALDHVSVGRYEQAKATLTSILHLVSKPKCEMHENFKAKHKFALAQLEALLHNFNAHNSNSIMQLCRWCKEMDMQLSDDIRGIRTLQLVSISPALAEKTDFVLAVPGTYKPFKPLTRIKYFVGQFSVYMSKQQPKDIVVMDDDGHFYQYLLKGHEDLRLDERIMQFFSMINSLMKKDGGFNGHLIEAMCVIPLSISHGLVQWVPGTDTLRAVVQQYRKIHHKEPLLEYQLCEKMGYSTFDFLEPIQKLQIIQKVFSQVPDTDIADFFWLKSTNSESWLKQTNTFSVTCALTSVVGYVIGLGDRHPSNLLIDRNTGKVIHIDFGDCFELAAKRKFLPEVVPFRLTRMMVRAMGVVGYNGLFRTTFQNMSTLLRENKRVLIMVLAIFVQEPLVGLEQCERVGVTDRVMSPPRYLSKAVTGSVIDKGRVYMTSRQPVLSSLELSQRVKQKLSGTDFDTKQPLCVEEQAARLIEMATDTYHLAKMYSGWCPFW